MSVVPAEGNMLLAAAAPAAAQARPETTPPAVANAIRVLGAIALATGGVYLALWHDGVAPAWSAAGVMTMKANMAVALLLAAVALLLLTPAESRAPWRAAGLVPAAVVLLVGVLTLAEHAFGIDLGIDQLLAMELPGAVGTVAPNRIGLPGSASLALLGAGLLALRWRPRIAVALGAATCVVVLVPAVGFLYGIGPFHQNARLTAIAWPSVVALFSLAAGLLLAGAGEALWSDDPGRVLLRRVLLPTLVVPLGLGYLRLEGERRDLVDTATATGLFALALVVFLSALLWRSSALLSAAAAARARAAGALREREERLRGALQRLESLLENSPLAVIEWSLVDSRITRWSDAAARVFGWTADETVGKRVDEIAWIHPEDRSVFEQVMADMRSGRRPRNVAKSRNVAKDGSVLHCEWYNSTVADGAGNATAVLSLVLNVTERTRSEQALLEADRRKSEFLGVLSHELRNPLAPIRNSMHLLERASPGSSQAERAKEVIRRQADHLTRLVDDLLDVTRIARGKVELRRTRMDLGEIVRRTCEDHADVLRARGVALAMESGAPAWIDGDRTRVAQIVGNLLQNAAKFSRAGGTVQVRVGTADGQAEIAMRDDGIGMTPELMQHLFEPFVQGHRDLAGTRGGLGLGLALVKGLVEMHGGSVRAHSEGPGRGSEFVIRFPLAPATAAPEAAAPSAPPTPTLDGAHSNGGVAAPGADGGLEILLIEDNVDAAETLAEVLRLEGHRVRVAGDGASGIALALARRPDIVLCDIGLPDVDGFEVARRLRADRSLGPVRLIALTGYAQPADRAKAEASGFNAHLPKPPRLDALLAMLQESRTA